jgi:hypothetical protein|tara:strand:- start:29 stop:262 length:234 start_codon:yes stop_codon:yes gene_type:complete
MNKVNKGDRVCVKWRDIKAILHSEEPIEPALAETVGWVDAQSPTWLRLTTSRYIGELDDLKDLIVIPKGCIEDVERI